MGSKTTPTTRIFVDFTVTPGEKLELPSGEAHHIFKVLRARAGDVFEVSDATRSLYKVEVRENRETIALEELPTHRSEGDGLTLYQAVPKGQRMDLVMEKATELGVETIVPLVAGGIPLWSLEEKRSSGGAGWPSRRRGSRCSFACRRSGEPMSFAQALREVGESGGVLLHNDDELPFLEDVVVERPVGLFVGSGGRLE